jgi:hypothetical protein
MVTPFHTMSLVHISKTPVTYGGSWGVVWCGAVTMKLRYTAEKHDVNGAWHCIVKHPRIRYHCPHHSENEPAHIIIHRGRHWVLGNRTIYTGVYDEG